jgi:hypothetical protein
VPDWDATPPLEDLATFLDVECVGMSVGALDAVSVGDDVFVTVGAFDTVSVGALDAVSVGDDVFVTVGVFDTVSVGTVEVISVGAAVTNGEGGVPGVFFFLHLPPENSHKGRNLHLLGALTA